MEWLYAFGSLMLLVAVLIYFVRRGAESEQRAADAEDTLDVVKKIKEIDTERSRTTPAERKRVRKYRD